MNITSFTTDKLNVSKTNQIDESFEGIGSYRSPDTTNTYLMTLSGVTEENYKFLGLKELYKQNYIKFNNDNGLLVELNRSRIGLGIEPRSLRIYSSITSSYFYDIPTVDNHIGRIYGYDNQINNQLTFYEGFNSFVAIDDIYTSSKYNIKSQYGVITTGSNLDKTGLCYNIYSTQSFYDVPYIPFKNDDNFSLSFWFNPTSSTTDPIEFGKFQNLCYFVDKSTTYPFHIYLQHTTSNSYNVIFDQYVNNVNLSYTIPTQIYIDTWNHVGLIKSSSVFDLYINGTKMTSSVFAHPSEYNLSNIRFGGSPDWATNHSNLKGMIDEIRIYNNNISNEIMQKLCDNDYDTLNMYNYTYLGDIWYKYGLIVLNHPSEKINNLFGSDFNLFYDSTNEINEHEIILNIPRRKFNVSLSNTLRKDTAIPTYKDFVFESWFAPYITKIGLYNAENELLGIASLPYPIKKPKSFDLTFIIRYDII